MATDVSRLHRLTSGTQRTQVFLHLGNVSGCGNKGLMDSDSLIVAHCICRVITFQFFADRQSKKKEEASYVLKFERGFNHSPNNGAIEIQRGFRTN